MAAAGVDTQLTNDLLAAIDDGGSVGTLVRVDPDDEHDALLMAVRCGGATAGRPDERVVAPASFEPRRSKNPVGGRFVRKPTKPAAGLETARQALGRYEQPVAPTEHSPSGQSALTRPRPLPVYERRASVSTARSQACSISFRPSGVDWQLIRYSWSPSKRLMTRLSPSSGVVSVTAS